MADETTKVDVGGHQLRYRSTGEGDRAVVLLNGFVNTIDGWEEFVRELGDVGRVVALEQRAHGWSGAPEPPYSWEDLAGDVLKAMDALEIREASIIGHDLGGTVALMTALVAPERVDKIVLVGTVIDSDARQQSFLDEVVKSGRMNGLQGLAHSMWGPMSTRKVEGQPVGLTEIARLLQGLGEEPLTPRLGGVRQPILCLAGSDDSLWPDRIRAVADALGDAEVEAIEGGDHTPHFSQPAATATAIRRFLGAA